FSAQKGKCAISGEEFADAEHVAVWLKVPRAFGGFERYKNMVLIHKKYLILLQELPQAVIKNLIKTLNITKKMLVKINSLREQANLSAII
ncbi:group II intron reverse transcriptase/maturase, partial [Mediterraneibacter gnavus]